MLQFSSVDVLSNYCLTDEILDVKYSFDELGNMRSTPLKVLLAVASIGIDC